MKVTVGTSPKTRISTLKNNTEILHSHGGSAFHWPYSNHRDDPSAHSHGGKVEFVGTGWTPELKALYPKLLAGTLRPFTNAPKGKKPAPAPVKAKRVRAPKAAAPAPQAEAVA